MTTSTYSPHVNICLLFLMLSFVVNSADIIKGDSSDDTTSFNHPIKACCLGAAGRFYVGAQQPGAKDFALAGMVRESNKFFPLAPEKVNLNEQADQINPLHDAAISLMTMLYGSEANGLIDTTIDRAVIVQESAPSIAYIVETSTDSKNIRVLSNDSIKDATGTQVTSHIINISANNDQVIFAAVNDQNEKQFGKGNSGIALLGRHVIQEKKDDQTISIARLIQFDAELAESTEVITRAAKLNNETACLKIGADTKIDIVNNEIDMHWSNGTTSFYAGLNVCAQGEQQAGARAVAVGYLISGKLIFKPIAPDEAFDGSNNIIGGRGCNTAISIHQVRSILTTTVLNYLVVLGGYTSTGNTRRTVYALPLVKNIKNILTHGTLAKKGSPPLNTYFEAQPHQLADRGFIIQAQKPGDLYTADDIEVQVGHGPLEAGDISQIFAFNDAVYAVVTNPDTNPGGRTHHGGIFHSQAIFDDVGRIKEWTSWKRVGGNFYDCIQYAHIDKQTGLVTTICGQTPDTATVVKRTKWDTGDNQGLKPLVTWLNNVFTQDSSGIRGITEMRYPATENNAADFLVATGTNRVAIAQLTEQTNDILGGDLIAKNPIDCTDGAINTEIPCDCNAISISGGALNSCGTLSCSAMTLINGAHFFFVGGSRGLAVLVNNLGCSLLPSNSLNMIVDFKQGSTFKTIGSYKFIRTLMCDDERALLYVMCDNRVDRINIAESNFLTGDIKITTIAQRGVAPFGRYETFFDGIFSKNSGILGTSSGLYCTKSLTDVRTALSAQEVAWTNMPLPEGLTAVKYLQVVSVTNRKQDYALSSGGNIYILESNKGKHRSMVHRCTVNAHDPNNGIFSLIPDHFLEHHPSYYAEFDGCRDWIHNEGMLFFHAQNRNSPDDPLVALLSVNVRSGLRFAGNTNEMIPVDLSQTNIIRPLIRLNSSGTWLLAKDDKLIVNE